MGNIKFCYFFGVVFMFVFLSNNSLAAVPDNIFCFNPDSCSINNLDLSRYYAHISEEKVVPIKAYVKNFTPHELKGVVSAWILNGVEPHFEDEEFDDLKLVGLKNTLVETEFSNTFTSNLGDFLIVGNNHGSLKTSYYSPSDFIINDLNDSVFCELDESGSEFCYTNTEVIVNYDSEHSDEFELVFNYSDISDIAGSMAHYHTIETSNWFKAYGAWEVPPVKEIVNLAFSCESFYDNETGTMAFGREGDYNAWHCPNTAYASVIRHEYGHAFLHSVLSAFDYVGNDSVLEDYKGYQEGVADTVAALSLDDSCVGIDLFGNDTGCLRDVEEDFVYPVLGNSHDRGRVLSGAFWDLQKALIDKYGRSGSEMADILFIQSIITNEFGLSPEIRQKVIQRDIVNYDGADIDLINSVFEAHGL